MRLTILAQVCGSNPIQLQRTEAVHLKHKMRLELALVVLATVSTALLATSSYDTTSAAANPIRKVVTMLQSMQKKLPRRASGKNNYSTNIAAGAEAARANLLKASLVPPPRCRRYNPTSKREKASLHN